MNIVEGVISIEVPAGCTASRFDGPEHGLSHCMKAVDFVIETPRATLFLEVKDPDAGDAGNRAEWVERLLSGNIDNELKYKFRDTWLYRHGLNVADKPIVYLVLIGLEALSSEALAQRTENLKRQLPLYGPITPWVNPFVESCSVHNLESWNRNFASFRARRT